MLEKTKKFLNSRLKLEVSEEKTKIVNLKRNYSDFLGIKFKIKKNKNNYKIVSHIGDKALESIEIKVKKSLYQMKKYKYNPNKLNKIIDLYNSTIIGIHNYYEMSVMISEDLNKINWISLKYLFKYFNNVLEFSNKYKSEYITKKYCKGDKKLPSIREKPIILIGNITYDFKLYRSNKINYFDEKSRKIFHKDLQLKNEFIIDKLLNAPLPDKSVELNDNIIPVFCGQYGKYKITNELIINYNNINIIKINNNEGWDAVVRHDGFFDNVYIIKYKREFVKLVNEDKDLLGSAVARYILTKVPCTHLKLMLCILLM